MKDNRIHPDLHAGKLGSFSYFSDFAGGDQTQRESRAMGLELEAACVTGRPSNQLNYAPQA
jgi:hypothetical protein